MREIGIVVVGVSRPVIAGNPARGQREHLRRGHHLHRGHLHLHLHLNLVLLRRRLRLLLHVLLRLHLHLHLLLRRRLRLLLHVLLRLFLCRLRQQLLDGGVEGRGCSGSIGESGVGVDLEVVPCAAEIEHAAQDVEVLLDVLAGYERDVVCRRSLRPEKRVRVVRGLG